MKHFEAIRSEIGGKAIILRAQEVVGDFWSVGTYAEAERDEVERILNKAKKGIKVFEGSSCMPSVIRRIISQSWAPFATCIRTYLLSFAIELILVTLLKAVQSSCLHWEVVILYL